jgi:hypothetical protein
MSINPHILCISKDHMEEQDLLNFTVTGSSLGSSYCHQNKKGGACIFVRKDQSFKKLILASLCRADFGSVCN